ncbi:MAG: OmpA family protein [Saprospiraceae bacterium]|nr:OmpA family protein [Saprospiraceae bacterium]
MTQSYAQVPYDTLVATGMVHVYFEFGKDHLTSSARDSITALIQGENGGKDRWIDIVAHTDSIGTDQSNQSLARRRAQSVATFLQQQHWPAAYIRKTAVGERVPVASNDTEEGRQANRRATITLLKRRVLTRIQGQVLDDSTGVALEATVHILARDWQDSASTDKAGQFSYELPAGEVVRVDIRRPGHFFSSQMLRAMPGLPPLDIRIKPIVTGAKADIQNLYFFGNQAVLLPRSEPELPILLQFMQVNPQIIVEIAGHVNVPFSPPVDSVSFSFGLSIARAKMVYEYLIEHGVPPFRLAYNGYGNQEMRFPYASNEKQQALNRRVEIRILGTGKIISKKAPLHDPSVDGG